MVFEAGITYHFNSKLLEKSHTREDERYIANIFGQFCDDLTELSMPYWTSEVTRKNSAGMLLLARKISAHDIFMSKFLFKNFPNNNDMATIFRKTHRAITGGNFAGSGRNADVERAAKAVVAIIDLKMTVAQVVKIK